MNVRKIEAKICIPIVCGQMKEIPLSLCFHKIDAYRMSRIIISANHHHHHRYHRLCLAWMPPARLPLLTLCIELEDAARVFVYHSSRVFCWLPLYIVVITVATSVIIVLSSLLLPSSRLLLPIRGVFFFIIANSLLRACVNQRMYAHVSVCVCNQCYVPDCNIMRLPTRREYTKVPSSREGMARMENARALCALHVCTRYHLLSLSFPL